MPEEISTTLQVRGMDRDEEIKMVHAALKPLPGVRDVQVNPMASKVIVTHGPAIARADYARTIFTMLQK